MELETTCKHGPRLEAGGEISNLLHLFFTLTDNKSESAAERLARELFTPDGQVVLTHQAFNGTSGNDTAP